MDLVEQWLGVGEPHHEVHEEIGEGTTEIESQSRRSSSQITVKTTAKPRNLTPEQMEFLLQKPKMQQIQESKTNSTPRAEINQTRPNQQTKPEASRPETLGIGAHVDQNRVTLEDTISKALRQPNKHIRANVDSKIIADTDSDDDKESSKSAVFSNKSTAPAQRQNNTRTRNSKFFAIPEEFIKKAKMEASQITNSDHNASDWPRAPEARLLNNNNNNNNTNPGKQKKKSHKKHPKKQ